jgi:DNA polymerase family B
VKTDSIFFTLPHPEPVPDSPNEEWMQDRMVYVFEQADNIAADITARLAEMYAPHCTLDMEFEGVMFPSLYLKKKNYAACFWKPTKPGQLPKADSKLKIKGLVSDALENMFNMKNANIHICTFNRLLCVTTGAY